jgi:hypothetical protein
LPTDATTNVEMQGADGALGPQHDSTWSPDPGDYIEPMAQQTFWNDTVKKLLPARRPTGGSGQPATVGEWKLGAGLFHHPPEPKDGMPISIAALCLVPVFVWAPTLLYSSVVVRHFRQDGQAPCPLGGWGHDTIHKSFASRHVYAECRHCVAYGTVHFCKQCARSFVSWNPDSMKHWPGFVQSRLKRDIHFGRKVAVVRTLADRWEREGPFGAEMGHFAKEKNEREIKTWRRLQAEWSSHKVFDAEHPTAVAMTQPATPEAWPAFDSPEYGGKLLAGPMIRTVVGQLGAAQMYRITLRVQACGGKVWMSDDAFKRCGRVSGPAIMDHTLGNEHTQIIAFFTEFMKSSTEIVNVCYPKIYRRYRIHNFEMPVGEYVDNPRTKQQQIGGADAIIPSLSDGSKFKSRQYLRFTGTILVCEKIDQAPHMCAALIANIQPDVHGKAAIGVDLEWEHIPDFVANPDSDKTQKPTAVGFATPTVVVIVRTSVLGCMPAPFKALLENATILKVGANISGDAQKLYAHFDELSMTPTACVLAEGKKKVLETTTNAHGLVDYCDTLIGKKMLKDELLRCSFSNDKSRTLTKDQQMYLALDSVVPLLLWEVMMDMEDLPGDAREILQANLLASDIEAAAATSMASVASEIMMDGAEPSADAESTSRVPAHYQNFVANGDVSEDEGIRPSKHQVDIFHVDFDLAKAAGTTNTWSSMFLKVVNDVLLVLDPVVRSEVLEFLTQNELQRPGMVLESAKLEAEKQLHGFLTRNSKYRKVAPLPPEETFALLNMVEACFAGCVCPKSKTRLFKPALMKAWKNLKKLVLEGHVCGIEGVPRYSEGPRCTETGLRTFRCEAGTNWVERWHRAQKESAARRVGMIFADIMLHHRVDRNNIDAGVNKLGCSSFGALGTSIYDLSVIEELHQIRDGHVGTLFTHDECDSFSSPVLDTLERFGLAWKMGRHFSVLPRNLKDGQHTATEFNEMEKHLEFAEIKVGATVTKLDIEVLATLVQGEQTTEEQMRFSST